jgi:hypothetical protein
MNDVYIIESWLGERLNVREVYAADSDDAVQTHQMHYPGARIVSVCAYNGRSSRSSRSVGMAAIFAPSPRFHISNR